MEWNQLDSWNITPSDEQSQSTTKYLKKSDNYLSIYPERITFPSTTSEQLYSEHRQEMTRTTKRKQHTALYTIDRDLAKRTLRNIWKGANGNRPVLTQHRLHPSICTNKKQMTRWLHMYRYIPWYIPKNNQHHNKSLIIPDHNPALRITILHPTTQITQQWLEKETTNGHGGTAPQQITSAILHKQHHDDLARNIKTIHSPQQPLEAHWKNHQHHQEHNQKRWHRKNGNRHLLQTTNTATTFLPQAKTTQASITQLPTISTEISTFLPSLLLSPHQTPGQRRLNNYANVVLSRPLTRVSQVLLRASHPKWIRQTIYEYSQSSW